MELRDLPSVDELARAAGGAAAVEAARTIVARAREEIRAGADPGDLVARVEAELAEARAPQLRRVLNATGVLVHTNLGRAPLPVAALERVAEVGRGYSNLEYDLGAGARGSRQDHVAAILRRLTGAEAALVVNNNAAAVLLAAAALAGPGREIVVGRGQLVEIGGGFRVPDVVAQAGATLKEVGTTNRTRRADYERALGPDTGAILRAHPSNFRQLGFVQEVEIEELCELGVPVIDDVGSGNLAEDLEALADEPPVRRSVRAGAALVCFSGDKLLGGPQAGVMVGSRAAVDAARRHPLARALRLDKLSLAALEATLRLYRDPSTRAIPVLEMLTADDATLRSRAERLADGIGEVVESTAKVGGGALPLLELPGPAVAVDGPAEELAARLRAADPPVAGRIQDGRLLLDPRTLADDEIDLVRAALM
jgi:L-seryl-tRNA(Ser) seleniumtransferase